MVMAFNQSETNKENVQSLGPPEKRKFFATPTAKLNKSIVRGRGTKRNVISKAGLNISHTSMMYKQSLRANNKNLAKALDLSKQDIAALAKKVLELEQEKQEQTAKISVLRTLTDQSSDAVEAEIQRRMKLRLEQFRRKLENAAKMLHLAGDELHEAIVLCDHQPVKNIDEIVKDTLELTQLCTPDNFAMYKSQRLRSLLTPASNPVAAAVPDDYLSHADTADTDNRLSIVNESADTKRKSSLKHSLQTDLQSVSMDIEDLEAAPTTRSKRRTLRVNESADTKRKSSLKHSLPTDLQSVSMDIEDSAAAPTTRSKRRTLRGSVARASEDQKISPERTVDFPVHRSKRRIARLSANSVDTATTGDAIKPLETVFSAAHANVTPLIQRSPNVASPTTGGMGVEEVLGSLAGLDDKHVEEFIFNTKSKPHLNSEIPFDEIPVGKHTIKEAGAKENEPHVSKSRRETRIIRHGDSSEDANILLEENVPKFFLHISPPRIISKHRGKKDQATKSQKAMTNPTPRAPANESKFDTVQASVMPEVIVPGVDEIQTDPEVAPADLNVSSGLSMNGEPYCSDATPNVKVSNDAEGSESSSTHVEPPSRQMEILCKGSEIKVSVGSRDGGPARTKGKKKQGKKVVKKEDVGTTKKDERPKFKDPFDYSLSETFIDPAKTLSDFKEQLSAKTATEGQNNAPVPSVADPENSSTVDKEKPLGSRRQGKEKKAKKSRVKVTKELSREPEVKVMSSRPTRTATNTTSYKELLNDSLDEVETVKEKPVKNRRIFDISSDSTDSAEPIVKAKVKRKRRIAKAFIDSDDDQISEESSKGATHTRKNRAKDSTRVKHKVTAKGEKTKEHIAADEDKELMLVNHSNDTDKLSDINFDKKGSSNERLTMVQQPDSNGSSMKFMKNSPKPRVELEDQLDYESNSKVVVLRKSSLERDSVEELPSTVNLKRKTHLIHSPAKDVSESYEEASLIDSTSKTLVNIEDVDMALPDASTPDCSEEKQHSPPKRSRRAARNINFKEPSLGGKLRRGDPGTSSLYNNAPSTSKNSGKKRKQSSSGR